MNELRFCTYTHKLVYDKDKLLQRQLIVLKNKDGVIEKWTDFHKYARSGKKTASRSVFSGNDKRCVTENSKVLNIIRNSTKPLRYAEK